MCKGALPCLCACFSWLFSNKVDELDWIDGLTKWDSYSSYYSKWQNTYHLCGGRWVHAYNTVFLIASSTSPHMWLADADSLMCYHASKCLFLQAWACSRGRSHLDLCLLIGWTYTYPIRAQLLHEHLRYATHSNF